MKHGEAGQLAVQNFSESQELFFLNQDLKKILEIIPSFSNFKPIPCRMLTYYEILESKEQGRFLLTGYIFLPFNKELLIKERICSLFQE